MKKHKKKAAPKPETALVVPQGPKPQLSVAALISQGLATGANMEAMKGLYDLMSIERADQRRMQFNEAMAKFQAECPPIKKTKAGGKTANGAVAYYYAPLDAIVSQTKALIQKHGFSYTVKTSASKDTLTAICVVKHVAGHSEESSFEVPSGGGTAIMSGPQKVAAALTFAKRYAFCNAFGIMTGDEDNDAAAKVDVSKEYTPFLLAENMIKAERSPARLIKYREHVSANKEFTNQEKVQLMSIINEKLQAKP